MTMVILGHQSGGGADGRPHGQQNHADHANGHRDLQQRLAGFIFQHDAANVAFMQNLFEKVQHLFARDAELFNVRSLIGLRRGVGLSGLFVRRS